MEGLSEDEVIDEFGTFGIDLSKDSPLLDKLLDIGRTYQLTAETLNEEWVAYSTRQGGCKLDLDTLDKWEGDLIKSTRKTASSRRSVAKATPARQPVYVEEMETLTEENLDEMFGSVDGGDVGNGMDVMDTYNDKINGKKRPNATTPTHGAPLSKTKPRQQNGSAPRTPNGNTATHNGHHHTPHHSANTTTPFRLMAESGMLSSSPQATYSQRKNSGCVMCSLNPDLLPREWAGSEVKVHIQHYDTESAVMKPYLFMYQKGSEKAQILLEWIQEMGGAICNQHDLPSPLPINQPSLEPAMYVGMVVCEGEGHLNVHSCLLEGESHGSHMHSRGARVRLQIPDSLACSLFPGQVIAVEGVNNYNGIMVPSKIYDQGVLPPLPVKTNHSSQGLTILCAAGPFSTTDSLTFQPLTDLLKVVVREKPNLLILVGPFLDSSHPHVKNCEIPGNLTYEEFFKSQVLNKILKVTHSTKTRTILLPSQRDIHHPWSVYPQPPFTGVGEEGHPQGTEKLFCAPDPTILDVNGLCVGATSVDVLFHLSANIMVRGPVGDRMARVARHILQQKSFYPLLPTSTEVNLDLLKKSRTSLSVRPHLLFLPSNLKPFAKVCKSLGILEKDYFGLRYLDKNGEYLWINLRNPLHEQLVPGNRMVMDMRVKYFIKPQKILQPVTRFHYYRQLKKEVVQGRMQPHTLNKAARITALIAQIEKGDYRIGTEYPQKVMTPTNNDGLDAKIRREHQKIAGMSSEVAIEKFLEEVSLLDLYGVELFHVVDSRRVRKVIGVGPDCVQIFSVNMEPLKRFTYSSIQYTAFHAKKFTALISSPNNVSSHPEQVDFELQSRASAQALYRTVTEFHTFFKRDAVGRVVKSAGFCKSLLGNFKNQNPDRFYFDVVRTHREVIDHVWGILHPSTRFSHGDENDEEGHGSSNMRSNQGGSGNNRRSNRNGHHRSSNHSSRPPSSSQCRTATPTTAGEGTEGEGVVHSTTSQQDPEAPPLPPPSRHMQRGNSLRGGAHSSSGGNSVSSGSGGSNSMHRSRSVQDSGLRPPNFTHLPPLPPYSQRSCSSDAIIRANLARRPHLRTIPSHGPHMASTATFNPYLSPSISETGSDGEEDLYTGGSECYVTMSSRSDATYLPSTQSDPGTMGRSYRPHPIGQNPPTMPSMSGSMGSESSGAPSELYMTSLDSECSGASYRVNSPPPLYREVDEEHSVPLNFDSLPTSGGIANSGVPNSAAISLVSPIIPIASSDSSSAVFDFDAAAVLSRTQELEGELQRLRAAMTCRDCKQNPIGATFCPCGHTVCCYQCAQSMQRCWECNEPVTSVQRMLLTR